MNDTETITADPARAEEKAPRRALILAGGGMRVAYQAGVVRALYEAGLRFEYADGTSGGIMNLAMLLSGLSPEAMCDRWRTLNVRDFVSFMPMKEYLRGTDMMAMSSADGLRTHVFPHLGIDVAAIQREEGIQGIFNVCNYTRKTNEAIPHQQIDLDLLVAGVSLPVFLPPVPKGNYLYCDSVWIKDANLLEAVKRGLEEIWLVWCIGNTSEYKTGVFNQYVHMIEISANGALFEEFDRIQEINARIGRGESVDGRTRPVTLHLIKPRFPLPLDPDYFLGQIDGDTLVNMGYADACRYLRDRPEAGIALTPDATRMEDETLGLTFRETMQGGFALEATDPQEGAVAGHANGATLTLHAAVLIRDVARFISDPEHSAEIIGHLDFAPLDLKIPACKGVFNLFHPAGDTGAKTMVYELGFTHDSKNYYLAGRKEIKKRPGFDLWAETTSLFARLHEGDDATGPIVGAGILHLSLGELLKMLTTMHAVHARSPLESAESLAQFGRFFLGELWERYAPR